MAKSPNLPRGISIEIGTNRKTGKPVTYYRARLFWRGKQISLGRWESLTIAKAALERARLEIVHGVFVPPVERKRLEKTREAADDAKNLTVGRWAVMWVESLRGEVSPGTVSTYQSALRAHILPVLAHLRLIDVESDHITELLARVPTKGARDNATRVMRSMFNAAVHVGAGGIAESPMARIGAPRKTSRDRLQSEQLLEVGAVERIADLMPEHLRAAPVMAMWLALRQGELLGLQRRDLRDLDNPEMATYVIERQWHSKARPPRYLPPKSGSARGPLSIPPHVVPIIAEHVARYVADDPIAPVFPSARDNARPISQTALDARWRAARDVVAPGYRFHDLRHIGLTEYARSGATLLELMERGGHTDVKVAMRYQSAGLDRDRANAARMSERLRGE